MPTIQGNVLAAIGMAIVDAHARHGKLTADPVRACAILGREWGEAMDEALLATSNRAGVREPRLCIQNLYGELAQVAATAILMMEEIDEQRERKE